MAAKEFPTYTNQLTSVAPVQPVASFHNAAQGESALGAITTSVFNESSRQLAAINGQKAAEQGIQPHFPALTGADKEYVGAYKQTAFENAYTQGNRLFKNLALTASSDPEGANVQVLKDSIGQFMQGLQAKLPEDVYKKLQQSWAPQLDSEYYSLLQESNTKSSRDLRIQGAEYAQTEAQTTFNLAAEGNFEGAKESAARLAEKYPEQALKMYEDGVKVHALQDALSKGDTAKVSELVASDPDLAGYVAQFEASKRSHEVVNYIKAQTDLENGAQIGTVLAAYGLNSQHSAQLELINAKVQRKQTATATNLSKAIEKRNDPAFLSSLPNKELDEVFDLQNSLSFGNDPSLYQQATVAQGFSIPISKFNNALSASIKYGDTPQAVEALEVYRALSDKAPVSVDEVDSKAQGLAANYDLSRRAGNAPDLALANAREEIKKLDASTKEELTKQFDADIEGYKSFDQKANFVAKKLGVKVRELSPGIVTSFFSKMKSNYINSTPGLDSSSEMTAGSFNKRYGYTELNGVKQYVEMPIEYYTRDDEQAFNQVQNQLEERIQTVANSINDNYYAKDKRFDYKLEPTSESSLQKGLRAHLGIRQSSNKGIQMKRTWRDGSIDTVYIQALSDGSSAISEGLPNYYLSIVDSDGVQSPLPDLQKAQFSARFKPVLRGNE